MPVYVNPNEAMADRLLTDLAIRLVVDNRITPNKPMQEGVKPYIVFFKLGGGGETDLAGERKLRVFDYRLEFHADTDAVTEALRELCLDRLCGNSRKSIAVWRDTTNGVQGCFPVDDADADTLDDGTQIAGQTVRLWFCPQAI